MSTHEQATQEVRDAFDAVCKGRVEAAVKAEREACAKVCENWTQTPETTGMELALCATAIRARGNK